MENIIESSLAVELAVKLFAKIFVSSHTVQTVAQLISWMEEDLEPVWDTQVPFLYILLINTKPVN